MTPASQQLKVQLARLRKQLSGVDPRTVLLLVLLVVCLVGVYIVDRSGGPKVNLHTVGDEDSVSSGTGVVWSTAKRDVQRESVSRSLPKLRLPIWWYAPFLDSSSFGNEATALIQSLLHTGLAEPSKMWISLLQMDCEDHMKSIIEPTVHEELLEMKARANHGQRAIVVCHNMPKFFGRPSAPWRSCAPCPEPGYNPAYAIGRAMVETDRFHSEFIASCNSMDEVWTPTEFSRDVLVKSGVIGERIRVVPLAVNTSWFSPRRHEPLVLPIGMQVFGLPEKKEATPKLVSFLSIFKWENRKGWDVLLEAFLNEFTFQDPVQLTILTKPFLGSKEFQDQMQKWVDEKLYHRTASLPRIYIVSDQLPAKDYARLLASVNAFVLPTRGEGWGIPIVEAMSMGLPVIATNWSGPTAYLDESVGYPLSYTLQPVPDSEPYWFHGSKWAQPDVPHLQQLMRRIVNKPDEAIAKGTAARERMLDRYSPTAMAVKLFHEFRRIERKVAANLRLESFVKQVEQEAEDEGLDLEVAQMLRKEREEREAAQRKGSKSSWLGGGRHMLSFGSDGLNSSSAHPGEG